MGNKKFIFSTTHFNRNFLNGLLYSKLHNTDGYTIYNNVHQYHNYYTDEESKLTIFNSFMVLKCNTYNSAFFKELVKIPNLFVIDFDKEDYFWLSSLKSLRLAQEA